VETSLEPGRRRVALPPSEEVPEGLLKYGTGGSTNQRFGLQPSMFVLI
jgi:hypothetical protein